MGSVIALVLSNLPAVCFVAAIVVAVLRKQPALFAERLLDWMLLLAIGVQSIWAGAFHVFAPHMAAESIGWQVSPFQYEIGVADLAIGVTAVVSFWRPLAFKAAVVWFIVLSFAGFAIGHLRDVVESGNYSKNNFGILLILTVVQIVLLPTLLSIVTRHRAAGGLATGE